MSGRRRLRGNLPRLLGDHRSREGQIYRAHFAALEKRWGPFDELGQQYAGAVAAAWLEWLQAGKALALARQQRDRGRGRRPSAGGISRLQRRQGLSWATYDQALRRLQALAQNGHAADPVAALLGEGRR